MRFIKINKDSLSLRNGILTVPLDLGYELTIPIEPMIAVHEQLDTRDQKPMFTGSVFLGEMGIVEKPQQNPIKKQVDLDKYLLKAKIIPDGFPWDDLMVGFIYGSNENRDNFKWMLQFRKGRDKSIVNTMVFGDGVDIECPVSTYTWYEGTNWHGRFIVSKKDLIDANVTGPGICKLEGVKCGGYPEGDKSLIPEACTFLEIRYNMFTNKWYVHFRDDNHIDIKDPLELEGITADIKMKADTDRSFPKPKVTEIIKVSDIASILLISDRLTILGK